MLKEQYDELGKTELYPFEEGRAPSDTHLTLVAPGLRPLPPDMDSVVMLKRYIHKGKAPVGPKKDLDEGFEIEKPIDTEGSNAEGDVGNTVGVDDEQGGGGQADGVQTSVELELSVDPSTLSPEDQIKFLNELANMMGVDPSTLSISSITAGGGE